MGLCIKISCGKPRIGTKVRESYAMKIELKNSWIYKHFFSKYCSEVEITFFNNNYNQCSNEDGTLRLAISLENAHLNLCLV